ncbi:exonuclease SbcCD subunit D [candidate division KSB1 bacterium]|nr:exonuclease SbcCD subunit D [candidate division KSB1 bacterium]
MRVLHTSDWHLGRKLYDRSRLPEQTQFLAWLLQIIKQEQVQLLLLAGDVFDSSVPPAAVTEAYYDFLFRFYRETQATAIIIAGNHDSAIRLAAPREFLKIARIHVVGNINAKKSDYVIPVTVGAETIWVVALPYLAEGEILSHVSFETEIESVRRYRAAIRTLYAQAVADLPENLPKILMGHFFLDCGVSSDSERPIQVGGSNPVHLDDFPGTVSYVALGHLHRPQTFENLNYPVVFSGSPIPMTFKEAEYTKHVYLLDLLPQAPVTFKPIPVPQFRPLMRVTGTLDQILKMAEQDAWEGALIEVLLNLDLPQIGISDQIRQAFAEKGGEVASVQTQFVSVGAATPLNPEDLTSQSPIEMFNHFYQELYGEPTDSNGAAELVEFQRTFQDLLNLWQQRQEEAE